MQSPPKRVSRWLFIRRAVLLSFALGLLITTALVLIAAVQFGGGMGPGTYHLQLGPLNFFTVIKDEVPAGSTSQLRPGFGVVVLNVLLPVLAGLLAWRKYESSAKQAAAGS
jgi:hypothetical protein